MRMPVTLEFANAGSKSGTHRVLMLGRGTDNLQAGDIGLSLDEAKTLISAIQDEFVSAQAAEIVDTRRRCGCWTKRGAHLLLQVRCAVLNGELLERFQRWFPAVGTRQVGLPWYWQPHCS